MTLWNVISALLSLLPGLFSPAARLLPQKPAFEHSVPSIQVSDARPNPAPPFTARASLPMATGSNCPAPTVAPRSLPLPAAPEYPSTPWRSAAAWSPTNWPAPNTPNALFKLNSHNPRAASTALERSSPTARAHPHAADSPSLTSPLFTYCPHAGATLHLTTRLTVRAGNAALESSSCASRTHLPTAGSSSFISSLFSYCALPGATLHLTTDFALLNSSNDSSTPPGCADVGVRFPGVVARGLARPPATFVQPSGLKTGDSTEQTDLTVRAAIARRAPPLFTYSLASFHTAALRSNAWQGSTHSRIRGMWRRGSSREGDIRRLGRRRLGASLACTP